MRAVAAPGMWSWRGFCDRGRESECGQVRVAPFVVRFTRLAFDIARSCKTFFLHQSEKRTQTYTMKWPQRIAIPIFLGVLVACQSQHAVDHAAILPASQPVPRKAWKDSIVYSDFSADPLVINGKSYERCQLELPDHVRSIVLPKEASIYRHGESSVTFQVEKSLSWVGHPDVKTSIDDVRSDMGIAIEAAGRVLKVRPYGTWDSFEGGAYLKLIAGVPKGIRVRFDRSEGAAPAEWVKVPLLPSTKSEYERHQR